FGGMTQDECRLHVAVYVYQPEQGFVTDAHGIVAQIKEFDLGAQHIGGLLRFFATGFLYLLERNFAAFAPQLGRFATLSKRQAHDFHSVALTNMGGNGPGSAPDASSRMRADDPARARSGSGACGHG